MKYLYLLATLLFASCDIPCPLLFNGREVYQFSTDIGNIILSGETFDADRICIESQGPCSFALDSIKLIKRGVEVPRHNIRFCCNKVRLGDSVHIVTLNEKGLLEIYVSQWPGLSYGKDGKIVLLPSNFIQYKDSAVIQDTVVITKGRRQKLLR